MNDKPVKFDWTIYQLSLIEWLIDEVWLNY